MDRPKIVTRAEMASPRHEQTAGMARGEAFAHDGVWAGYSDFPGGATTGWHHHGDYATYGYITEGTMILEHGDQVMHVHAGDFVYIPPHLVHRESVPEQGCAGAVLRVGGSGPTVYNVEDNAMEHSTTEPASPAGSPLARLQHDCRAFHQHGGVRIMGVWGCQLHARLTN